MPGYMKIYHGIRWNWSNLLVIGWTFRTILREPVRSVNVKSSGLQNSADLKAGHLQYHLLPYTTKGETSSIFSSPCARSEVITKMKELVCTKNSMQMKQGFLQAYLFLSHSYLWSVSNTFPENSHGIDTSIVSVLCTHEEEKGKKTPQPQSSVQLQIQITYIFI